MKNKYCRKCGNEVTPGLKYCLKCGEAIDGFNLLEEKKKKNTLLIISICIIFTFFAIVGLLNVDNEKETNNSFDSSQKQEITNEDNNNENLNEDNSDESINEESTLSETKPIIPDYDLEIESKELTDYYYEYGYRQGNITYFGKRVKTSATFNSSDSSWPKAVYMDAKSGSHYQIACTSFKGNAFKKMSSKSKGETIYFIGKVDELISSNNYRSGILTFDECEILE